MAIIKDKTIISELAIRQLTLPAEDPINLSEQKIYSRIDGDYEDSLITMLIKASTKKCEDYVRGGFISRTYSQTEDAGQEQNQACLRAFLSDNEYAIEIKNIKVSSVEEVSFYDYNNVKHVIATNLYRLDRADNVSPARIVFDYDISITPSTRYFTQYEIKYTAGYADALSVPDDIKLAIMQTAQGYYENRETMSGIPPVAKNMLQNYRIIEL